MSSSPQLRAARHRSEWLGSISTANDLGLLADADMPNPALGASAAFHESHLLSNTRQTTFVVAQSGGASVAPVVAVTVGIAGVFGHIEDGILVVDIVLHKPIDFGIRHTFHQDILIS